MSVTKSVPEDIHYLAKVPADRNPDIYQMTVDMMAKALEHCEQAGMSLTETKVVLGKRKDELIRELISLRERGIVRGDDSEERRPKAEPMRLPINQINIKRPN